MRSGRINYKSLQMCNFHFMGRQLSPYAVKLSPYASTHNIYGESVMELRVQIKVCEGCGCLWYRVQTQETVYCRECAEIEGVSITGN